MTMTTNKRGLRIPAKPRYHYVNAVANEFWGLVDYELPLDPLKVLKEFGCKVKTYQKISEKTGLSVEEVGASFCSKDGSVCYDALTDSYRLAYNHSHRFEARMRWTLAHELGHIVLNHLTDFPQTNYEKDLLTNEQLEVLDKEANAFAGEILAPESLLIGLAENVHRHTAEFYFALSHDIFKLSAEASYYRAIRIVAHLDNIIDSWPSEYPNVFNKYIDDFLVKYGEVGNDSFASHIWLKSYSTEFEKQKLLAAEREGMCRYARR